MSKHNVVLNEAIADGGAEAENAHKERSPSKGGKNAPEETTPFLGEGEMMEHDHCAFFKKMSKISSAFVACLQTPLLCPFAEAGATELW